MRESEAPVSLNEAAAFLHALPKPIGLAGSLRDGVLTLHTDDEELSRYARALCESSIRGQEANQDYEFLRARHGDALDDLEVVCFTAGAYLRVRLADLREFEREYSLGQAGNRGMDFADSAYPLGQGADPARLAGAAAFVAFFSGCFVQ
ncbi:MAG: hypothetical protein ACJ8GN_13255 [Longimicrobiaceae bacterium]